MVSKSRSSGNVGKGLNSAWVTSGGLGGAARSEPMCDCVSVTATGEWCDSGGSGNDCFVSAESEVSSVGSTLRDGS